MNQSTTPTDITLTTADGAQLAATHYAPAHDAGSAQQWIVVGSATAVPRGFYARFAQYAASRGVHVITTDYRGIGGSKHGSLKGFVMDYSDWSRYDLAAAVDYAAARGKVWMVGHSLAGHAIGQLPNHEKLEAAYVCGTGAGWHGWMPRPERYRVWALWNMLGPVLTRIYGYQPMSKMGLGEDIPMGVYRDWKRDCQFPHYFFDGAESAHYAATFAKVKLPIAAAVSTDDLWAPPASRNAFFEGYTGTHVQHIDFEPAQLGAKQVGHMGYYRKEVGAVLWPHMLKWLAQHGLAPSKQLSD